MRHSRNEGAHPASSQSQVCLGRTLGHRVLHVINMIVGTLNVGFGVWQLVPLLTPWLRT